MTRFYAPNMEPDIVMACGCIETNAFAYKRLGTPGEFQGCDNHPEGKGPYGTQKILRRATPAERILWYDYGIPAAKRRGTDPLAKLLNVQAEQKGKAGTKPRGQQPRLF